jgi:hypothetical protein
MKTKTFQVNFEDPGKISNSKWIKDYLKPAIIMMLRYRKTNKAIPVSSFRYFRQFKKNGVVIFSITQTVKTKKIIVDELYSYLSDVIVINKRNQRR